MSENSGTTPFSLKTFLTVTLSWMAQGVIETTLKSILVMPTVSVFNGWFFGWRDL